MVDLILNEALSDELRDKVRKWAKTKKGNFLFQIARYGMDKEGQLYKGLRYRVSKKFGLPHKVTYSFPKHGIFQELGVGPEGDREPRPWISDALSNKDLDELADIIGDVIGDGVIEPIRNINLKG